MRKLLSRAGLRAGARNNQNSQASLGQDSQAGLDRESSRGSSSTATARKLVRDSIIKVSRRNYQNESFVPCNEIEKLVTRDFVESTLVESKIDNHERLVEFIVGEPGAKRLFLILGRVGQFHLLGTLHDNHFDDHALPVGFRINDEGTTEGHWLNDPDGRVFPFFDKWEENDLVLLEAFQWEFLSPKFGESAFPIFLQRAHRLPYLTRQTKPSGDGFFGEVYHAEILKAHLAPRLWPTSSKGDTVEVAIRKAKNYEQFASIFDREAANLRRIREEHSSPHILRPIAAYIYGDERCLILPWADGGNLLNEWERLLPRDVGAEKVLWFLEQFVGLCEALEELHTKETQNCIHGDLKPENILMFSQSGSNAFFQIADLGLAAFHIEAHTSMRVATGVGSGTSRYQPPEMRGISPDVSRGRANDIWSMGCILLEFLVWLTSGYDGLRKFQGSTSHFWNLSRGGSILHSTVEDYLALAEQKLASSSVLNDVLLLVKEQLLVQKPERVGATKLRENLQGIRDKCNGSSISSFTPVRFAFPVVPAPHAVDDDGNDGNDGNDTQSPKLPLLSQHHGSASESSFTKTVTSTLPSGHEEQSTTITSVLEGSEKPHGTPGGPEHASTGANLDQPDVPDDVTDVSVRTSASKVPGLQTSFDVLGSRLSEDVSSMKPTEDGLSRMRTLLPIYLEVCALKLGREPKGSPEIMRFMVIHRSDITRYFQPHVTDAARDKLQSDKKMDSEEIMDRWIHGKHTESDSNIPMEAFEGIKDMVEEEEHSEEDEAKEGKAEQSRLENKGVATGYDQHIKELGDEFFRSGAYLWLKEKLEQELNTTPQSASAPTSLSKAMLDSLRKGWHIGRKSIPPPLRVTFRAGWHPHSFIEQQYYGIPLEEAVLKALVLIGTITQAEALVCGEYIRRMWPNHASVFMKLLEAVMKGKRGSQVEVKEDWFELQATANDAGFELVASGPPDMVLDIGEQLMWISCALRSSTDSDNPASLCKPTFEVKPASVVSQILKMDVHLNAIIVPFEGVEPSEGKEREQGTCWLDLFSNPVLVQGYPIWHCPGFAAGLHLSFATMMTLMQAPVVTHYEGKLFIKSHSALLVATKDLEEDNTIVWHAFTTDDDSNYISYHDRDISSLTVDLSLMEKKEIAQLRHVIYGHNKTYFRRGYRQPESNGNITGLLHDQSPISIRSNDNVTNHEGYTRPANEHHDEYRPRRGSYTLQSDGGSLVTTVSDLGFNAAPAPSSMWKCGCGPKGGDQDDTFDHVMTAEELRNHLNLQPTPGMSIAQSLRRSMSPAMLKSEHDGGPYFPLDAFETFFCKQSIKSLLKESGPPEMTPDGLRNRVQQVHHGGDIENMQSRRRILAILTMMDRLSYIDNFFENDVWDRNLPINLSNTEAAVLTTDWDENDRVLFNTYQKRFLIPFFDFLKNKLPSYIFNEHIRLPWLKDERVSVGMNGVIHQIQIHPSHHNYAGVKQPEAPQYFALKEIQAHDRDSYKKELSALEKVLGKTQNEKHLIKLLLTFQHGERFYLVFEWADGNLLQFWGRQDMAPGGRNNHWAVTQCLGLATALKRIHGPSTWQRNEKEGSTGDSGKADREYDREYGRHGDIKPENILWFETYEDRRNHLVLSDLGLTRYHSHLTRSQVLHSDLDGMTRQYRAPEVDLGVNILPSYDIWSLGYVFLEFYIWYLMGVKELEKFEQQLEIETEGKVVNFQEANLFNIEESPSGQKTAVVKPAVAQWINKLRGRDHCPELVRDILNLVEEHMIVVEAKNRWNIDQICTEISTILSSLPTTAENKKLSTPGPSRSPSVSKKQRDETVLYVSTNPMQQDTTTDDTGDYGLRASQEESDRIESSQSTSSSSESLGPSQEVVDVLRKWPRFPQHGASENSSEPGVKAEDGHPKVVDKLLATKANMEAEPALNNVRTEEDSGILCLQREAENARQAAPIRQSFSGWQRLYLWMTSVAFPPRQEFQRVAYICGCGELAYVDVKPHSPSGLQQFHQRLLQDLSSFQSMSGTDNQGTAQPFKSSPTGDTSNQQPLSTAADNSHVPEESDIVDEAGFTSNAGTLVQDLPRFPRYLHLCINVKALHELVPVHLPSDVDDNFLFEKIFEAYMGIRKTNSWTMALIVPRYLKRLRKPQIPHYIANLGWPQFLTNFGRSRLAQLPRWRPRTPLPPVSHWLGTITLPQHLRWPSILSYLNALTPKVSLYQISDGHYVRFRLIPIHEKVHPTRLIPGKLPPAIEVTERRYDYEPLEEDEAYVDLDGIPLAHLLKPGRHSSQFWVQSFPKKLRVPLGSLDGSCTESVVGWGVRINERLSWAFVMLWIFVILISIGVVTVVYAIISSDQSAAFGLGSYLAASVTVYITYQYFSWVEAI